MIKKTKKEKKNTTQDKELQKVNEFFLKLKDLLEEFEVDEFEPCASDSEWDRKIKVVFVHDGPKSEDTKGTYYSGIAYHFSTHRDWETEKPEVEEEVSCADTATMTVAEYNRSKRHIFKIERVVKDALAYVLGYSKKKKKNNFGLT